MARSSLANNMEFIVTVSGYDNNPFPWITDKKNNMSENCMEITGIIVRDETTNKLYVLTLRKSIIGYQKFAVFYRNDTNIFTGELHILFQSIEYNVIVFGTVGSTFFDYAVTVNINDSLDIPYEPKSYNFGSKLHLLKPLKKYTAIMNHLNLQSDTEIDYQVHLHNLSYLNSKPNDQTYVPALYTHIFKIKNKEEYDISTPDSLNLPDSPDSSNSSNILNVGTPNLFGAFVITSKQMIVGVINSENDNMLWVEPFKYMENGFCMFLKYHTKYHTKYLNGDNGIGGGFEIRDFMGNISDIFDPHTGSCSKTTKVNTVDGAKLIKKDDILVGINGITISMDQTLMVLYDSDINQIISLPIYCKMYPLCLYPTTIVFRRKQKEITLVVTNVLTESNTIALSMADHFNPSSLIPYYSINGLIITTLTHELIDILYSQYQTLKNELIEKIISDQPMNNENCVMIIDCRNANLQEMNYFPVLSNKKRKTLEILILSKINNIQVKTINDVIPFSNSAINSTSSNKVTFICCGSTLDNQQKIKIGI